MSSSAPAAPYRITCPVQLVNLPSSGDETYLTADPTGNFTRSTGAATPASVDAFVNSKGQAQGLSTLDATGNVPAEQLGNVGLSPAVSALIVASQPWTETAWMADLSAQADAASGAMEIPIYTGQVSGSPSGVVAYFVNAEDVALQPFVVEVTLTCARTVALAIDSGDGGVMASKSASFTLAPGAHTIVVPAPYFSLKQITAGAYVDKWSGGNGITLATSSNKLCFYMGIGFPGGPGIYPPDSPFGFGYTIDGSPYLESGAPLQVRGWRREP